MIYSLIKCFLFCFNFLSVIMEVIFSLSKFIYMFLPYLNTDRVFVCLMLICVVFDGNGFRVMSCWLSIDQEFSLTINILERAFCTLDNWCIEKFFRFSVSVVAEYCLPCRLSSSFTDRIEQSKNYIS